MSYVIPLNLPDVEPDEIKTQRRRKRKPRKPTLTSIAKEAAKAHINVARYEIGADGRIVIVTSHANDAPSLPNWRANEWDEVFSEKSHGTH
jgi:hypothetical protein